jgi:hypothetical protein
MAGDEGEVNQSFDDTEWDEIFIYRLSARLGGRSEVLETPVVEALKYIELEKKREQEERFFSFLSMFHAHPMADAEGRKKFIEAIQPKVKSAPVVYETNLDQLKQLKAMQGEGV